MKNTKYLTRQEAAEKLGVSRQTVSNYINRGYLKVRKNKGVTYIIADDFESKAESLSCVINATNSIEALKKKLLQEEEELLKELSLVRSISKIYGREVLYNIIDKNLYDLTNYERDIVLDLFTYGDSSMVADKYGLTRARILQLYGRAMRNIVRQPTMKSKLKEIETLKEEVQHLTRLVNLYRTSEEKKITEREKAEIDEAMRSDILLSKKVSDCYFSVRLLNCLKCAEIETVGELVKMRKRDFFKMRNFGKKSMRELEEWLEKEGLQFLSE